MVVRVSMFLVKLGRPLAQFEIRAFVGADVGDAERKLRGAVGKIEGHAVDVPEINRVELREC